MELVIQNPESPAYSVSSNYVVHRKEWWDMNRVHRERAGVVMIAYFVEAATSEH